MSVRKWGVSGLCRYRTDQRRQYGGIWWKPAVPVIRADVLGGVASVTE